jgi:cytochrome P450
VVYAIIERRKRTNAGSARRDLLQILLDARDPETGARLSDRALRDEAVTFIFAGYETTATALAWTVYLLLRHPEIGRRVDDELAQALGGRAPRHEQLDRLPYTMSVFKESMRLYPPVWGTIREAQEDDLLGGQIVKKGTFVAPILYLIHRDPRYWDRPEEFWPDRFLKAEPAKHKYAYLPFAIGPRVCIGQAFALQEAMAILSVLLSRLRFELETSDVRPVAMITLKPDRPIIVRSHPAT